MRYIRFIVVMMCAVILLSGCYSHRPFLRGSSKPDYNTRMVFSSPGYIKSKTFLGLTFGVSLIGAGGYAGYKLAPFQHQTAEGLQPTNSANIAAGAIIGAGIALLTDAIMGRNKCTYENDYQKWLDKNNPEYKVFKLNRDGTFSVIKRDAENVYRAESLMDLLDFKLAFPNSQRESAILREGLPRLSRAELPEVVKVYAGNPTTEIFKKKYLDLSYNFTELMEARERYPDIPYDYEKEGISRLNNMREVAMYYKNFPQSEYSTDVFNYVLRKLPAEDYGQLINIASAKVDKSILRKVKLAHIMSFPIKKMLSVANAYSDITREDILNELYKRNMIYNLDSLRSFAWSFGYVKNHTERFVMKIAKGMEVKDYGKILDITPTLDDTTMQHVRGSFWKLQKEEYQAALAEKEPYLALDQFVSFYKKYSYDKAVMSEAIKMREYHLCYYSTNLQSCAEFVKKYPQYFKEIDKLVYSKIVESPRPYSIEAYKKHWSKGAYVVALDKLWDRAVRLAELDEIRAIKDAQQRSAEDQRRAREEIEREIQRSKDRECSSCKGSGICSSCHGAGYRNGEECWSCDGKGRCVVCRGSGRTY